MPNQPFYAQWSFEVTDYALWHADLMAVTEVLQSSVGFESLSLLHSPDEPTHYSVLSKWQDVGSYRRALSATNAKLVVWPFLASMLPTPTVFETLLEVSPSEVIAHASTLQQD